jgi:hypothetical protein
MGLLARPRRFISIAAAVMTAVLPAPTQCASSVLSFCRMRHTASFWCLSRSSLRSIERFMPGKVRCEPS